MVRMQVYDRTFTFCQIIDRLMYFLVLCYAYMYNFWVTDQRHKFAHNFKMYTS